MSKMLTMEQLNQFVWHWDLWTDYRNNYGVELLDILQASIRVVEAAKELTLSRTAPHDWKGDPQKMVYQIERKALVNLMDALAPFREEKEPRT